MKIFQGRFIGRVGFSPIHTVPASTGDTRVTKSLIDYLSSNRPNNFCNVSVVKIGITDHDMKYGIRKLNARVHVRNVKFKTKSRSLKNYDRDSFLSDLRSIDWEMVTSRASEEPNKMASSFYDLFLAVLDVHAPLKRRTSKARHAHAPWISPNIKNLMCERDRIKRKAERDPALWPGY